MSSFIADLHCDLLCYLQNDSKRTAYDRHVRCSIPQMQEGGVRFQTMAVFTETGQDSLRKGWVQVEKFQELPLLFPEELAIARDSVVHTSERTISMALAIENASSIATEDEDLDRALKRLFLIDREIAKVVYISLTWNTENRFGGGAHTSVGLKEDGKKLLEALHGQKIAVDFSHASDALAFDVLNFIERRQLTIPVLASHSNTRKVTPVPRNLPDELIKEIFKRDGLIGLNFVRDFVGGSKPESLTSHLEHLLRLGGENHVCFGADFYYGGDVSLAYQKPSEMMFFPGLDNASVYPAVLAMWQKSLGIGCAIQERLAHRNLLDFLQRAIFI